MEINQYKETSIVAFRNNDGSYTANSIGVLDATLFDNGELLYINNITGETTLYVATNGSWTIVEDTSGNLVLDTNGIFTLTSEAEKDISDQSKIIYINGDRQYDAMDGQTGDPVDESWLLTGGQLNMIFDSGEINTILTKVGISSYEYNGIEALAKYDIYGSNTAEAEINDPSWSLVKNITNSLSGSHYYSDVNSEPYRYFLFKTVSFTYGNGGENNSIGDIKYYAKKTVDKILTQELDQGNWEKIIFQMKGIGYKYKSDEGVQTVNRYDYILNKDNNTVYKRLGTEFTADLSTSGIDYTTSSWEQIGTGVGRLYYGEDNEKLEIDNIDIANNITTYKPILNIEKKEIMITSDGDPVEVYIMPFVENDSSSIGVRDFNGVKMWGNMTAAASCSDYKYTTLSGYEYKDEIGDGTYKISVDGVESNVYCDMTTE